MDCIIPTHRAETAGVVRAEPFGNEDDGRASRWLPRSSFKAASKDDLGVLDYK